MAAPALFFKQLELGPMQNFVYLIGDPKTREAVVVDPGWEVPEILKVLAAEDYTLTRAIVTHHHFDHVMGLAELLKHADIPVHAHEADAPMLAIVRSSIKPFSGGETVRVGAVPIAVIHTPGHTPGSQCLLVDGRLLSGDTLFIGSCGRCDLPGGNAKTLHESLSKKLRALPDETVLFPGHNYAPAPSRPLGEEKKANPFLAAETAQDFLHLVSY